MISQGKYEWERIGNYFPANSFLTDSLTTLPSTRKPAALKRAIAFFMTVPISFIVGVPISAMTALTPAAISPALAAFGRYDSITVILCRPSPDGRLW